MFVVVCSFSRRDCRHLLSPRSPFAPVRPFGLTPRPDPDRSPFSTHTIVICVTLISLGRDVVASPSQR